MSRDELRHATGDRAGNAPAEQLTPLAGCTPLEPSAALADGTVREALTSLADETIAGDDVTVDASLVTQSLDEILLALIASAADETHGTGLMNELDRQFDTQLSPGTVYPRLHELESEGVLEMHELVHTKQYSIADRSTAATMIEQAVARHLAIARFLYSSLDQT